MLPVAEGWTKIAGRLKEISEKKDPGAFSRLSDPLLRQADMEQAFWEEAASVG